jgi:hypothetical protein
MANPSKRTGSGFEREVVRILQDNGIAAAERVPLSSAAAGAVIGDATGAAIGAEAERLLLVARRMRLPLSRWRLCAGQTWLLLPSGVLRGLFLMCAFAARVPA